MKKKNQLEKFNENENELRKNQTKSVGKKPWVVYAKSHLGSPNIWADIRHKIAISNGELGN